jgi:preprotein translocase subunit SecD
MKVNVIAIACVGASLLLASACTSSGAGAASAPASASAPSGMASASATPASSATPAASAGPASSSAPAVQSSVSITLTPVGPASAQGLAAAAQLLNTRAATAGLKDTKAAVVGGNVVLTGPATAKAALETMAGTGVLRMRQVLMEASGGTVSGQPDLVHLAVLKVFDTLTCTPGESVTTWQRKLGYSSPADWDDPTAQVVACDSSGNKYVLDVATVLGQEVTKAVASQPSPGQWAVLLSVSSAGASAFGALTTRLYNKYFAAASTDPDDRVLDQVAVVIDGVVVSAPEIAAPITAGRLQIFGSFTRNQIEAMAAQLSSGPLPVAFRIASTSTSS